jgi:hypothetical protein
MNVAYGMSPCRHSPRNQAIWQKPHKMDIGSGKYNFMDDMMPLKFLDQVVTVSFKPADLGGIISRNKQNFLLHHC